MKSIDEAFFRDPASEVIAKGGEIFCALREGAVVGTASAVPEADGAVTLAKFAVSPAMQGRGLGRRLCERVIDFARARRAPKVVLWTNATLTPARRVYHALGFSERPFPYAQPHLDADTYMELDLH